MRKKINILLALILIGAFVLEGCGSKAEIASQPSVTQASESQSQMNENPVRLEDDYYEYINYNTLKNAKIPNDSNSWSYFYELDEYTYNMLDEVLKDTVKNRQQFQQGSLEQKISDLYLTALDLDSRNQVELGALQPYLDEIRSASSVEAYLEAIGKVGFDLGHFSLISSQWYEDFSDSSRYACYLERPNLGLGKETLEDVTQTKLFLKYQDYIQKIMKASGLDEKEAAQAAADIFIFQKDLTTDALSLADQYDPNKIYNLYSKDELSSLFTNVDIERFLNIAGLGDFDSFVVTEKDLTRKVNGYLTEEHLPLLKNYSIFCLVNDFSQYLTPEIRDNALSWKNEQEGVAEKKTDEKLAGEMTQNILGFEFGKLYVRKCFSEKDKLAIEYMAHQIFNSYKKQIENLEWMGEATKAAAIKKLNNMRLKIGYPDIWPDNYAHAEVVSLENGGALINNVVSLFKASMAVTREKVYKPVDKTEWGMTPQTVNAYYNPLGNEIVFPAAILQPPFYNSDADFSTNLGGIGMVIAHEVSHAFDSLGSLYDENGNYNIWWTDEDRKKFEGLADRIVTYYDKQDVLEGRKVNGEQTLNENIADLGSLACITSIVGNDADNLRLLFQQYATIWAVKCTNERMTQRLNTDVHSPEKVRVNAVVSSTDAFYIAYPEIKEGDGMYLPPTERVKIW